MREPDDIVGSAPALVSDFEVDCILGDIGVDGHRGLTALRTDASDLDAKAKRYELIESVRAGKHIELAVTARTFRQQKGKSNRRYLRLGGDLAAQAVTFGKQPFLLDHVTWNHDKRKGSILSSKLVEETQSRIAFEMQFLTVKPDAVISVLDGTLDRFSVGWFQLGPVLCTVHGVDMLQSDSCRCWPGETVMVDGKPQIVEYEFTVWGGKELSGLSVPAVQNTNIESVRAALAAELNFSPTRARYPQPKEKKKMALIRLAAALGLADLTEADEDRALATVTGITTRVNAAETRVSALTTELAQAREALDAVTQATLSSQIDDAINTLGYRAGKMTYARDPNDPSKTVPSAREARLRKLAKRDGIEALREELADMPVIVRIGGAPQSTLVGAPLPAGAIETEDHPMGKDNPLLQAALKQLGFKDSQRNTMEG